jgi:DNA-binding beta-propeller fold protein YncE
MMRRSRFVLPCMVLLVCAAMAARARQGGQTAQNAVPQIKFHSVPDFLKLPPDVYFGGVAGVAVNSKGHIFVFSRGNTSGAAYGAAAAQLLEFGPNGAFIREIGHNLYAWSFAHAVRVDKNDNIWVADKGSDMVVEFNPAGRVRWCLGGNRRRPMRARDR